MEIVKIPRRFDFAQDRFAFANELIWNYEPDPATGRMAFCPRVPKPDYAHRCFVMVRAARQLLYNARWSSEATGTTDDYYRRQIRKVLARSARRPCAAGDEVVIEGYPDLHAFSTAKEKLLKEECGGAWQSYVLRSHWRMIFPISRKHQLATAARLITSLEQSICPIIHLVTFPALKINHGMIVFAAKEGGNEKVFTAYDPNNPDAPAELHFDCSRKTFSLAANRYWAGGDLNIIQIYQNWWM